MKRLSVKILYTLFFLLLTICILTHSQISLYYAFTGLELWYTKMIPALLPFMIISGIMVRLHLTESFSTVLYPVVRPLFQVSKNVCYAMIMGFLCGFPMGAKPVYDLYSRQMINKREAEY
ncbi:MAG: nucleoside recognition domain-containing protein, partial [Acetatifactor sp.]